MAISATSQNQVIFRIFDVFPTCLFFNRSCCICVSSHSPHDFLSLKLSPKRGHFWPFCLPIAFAKWPFLPLFKIVSFFAYFMFFRAAFFNKTYHKGLESFSVWFSIFKVEPKKKPFLTSLLCDSKFKMAIFATFQNYATFCIFDVSLSCFFNWTCLIYV